MWLGSLPKVFEGYFDFKQFGFALSFIRSHHFKRYLQYDKEFSKCTMHTGGKTVREHILTQKSELVGSVQLMKLKDKV